MIFLIINAVLSAILFLIVVLPPLYIYNPTHHPHESNEPPRAGEVIPDEDITHSVKQKLYLLYVIPFCAVVNALFLYAAYYRPIRYIHYRVELNLLTLRLTLDAGRQQLQKNGVLNAMNRNATVSNFSIIGSGAYNANNNNNSIIGRNYAKGAGRSFVFDGNENSRKKLASSVDWEWRRHARPKAVRRDAWVNSAVFAEISELRDEVEQRFLIEGSVADANFAKAVVKTVGAFVAAAPSTIVEAQTQLPKPESHQRGFYNSSRPPLMALGARSSISDRGGANNNNNSINNSTNSTNNNNNASRMTNNDNSVSLKKVNMRGAGADAHDEVAPQRFDSVVMVPTENTHHRSGGSSGGGEGSGQRAGGARNLPGSALRFFKGVGHKSNNGSNQNGNNVNGSSSNSNSGNRVEYGSPTQQVASPVRRDAFEPVTVDDMSPIEPKNSDTAVRSSGLDDSAQRKESGSSGGEGGSGKQNLWGRLWHKNENKET